MTADASLDVTAAIGAAGSLPRRPRGESSGLAQRVRLLAEMALFFVGAPLAMSYAVHGLRLPLFLLLPPLLLAFVAYLLWDPTFAARRELAQGFRLRHVLYILAIFVVGGACVTAYVADEMPRQFLSFPRRNPDLWRVIMLLYPVLSVLPQELVYRTFFFHRYGPLFGTWRWAAILVNAALFGFAHILFNNWVAPLTTAAVGVLFAYRYETTRSFWAVWIEHTLWGWLAFTVGLGGYFFTGVANPGW